MIVEFVQAFIIFDYFYLNQDTNVRLPEMTKFEICEFLNSCVQGFCVVCSIPFWFSNFVTSYIS